MGSNFNGQIRVATESDILPIQQIYDVHTRDITSVISFEEKTPSVGEMTRRWKDIRENNLPFLVYEVDGVVAGYAYVTRFRSRVAYRHTVEESVYVGEEFQGRGIGRKLMLAIIDNCKKINVRCIVAVIGGNEQNNPCSVAFHRKVGFKDVGILHDAGYKNGRWVDIFVMEYIIK